MKTKNAEPYLILPPDWECPEFSNEAPLSKTAQAAVRKAITRLASNINPAPYIGCIASTDWADPHMLQQVVSDYVATQKRAWWEVFSKLSWLDRMEVLDTALNQHRRPEAWMFRIGVVRLCQSVGVPAPAWPPIAWPLNNIMDRVKGDTLLHTMMMSGSGASPLLLPLGANPNRQNKAGKTPLHLAAGIIFPYWQQTSHYVNALLNHGARWDVTDGENRTPLQIALDDNHYCAALDLIVAGARDPAIAAHREALRAFARQGDVPEWGSVLEAEEFDVILPVPKATVATRRNRI